MNKTPLPQVSKQEHLRFYHLKEVEGSQADLSGLIMLKWTFSCCKKVPDTQQ